MRELIALSALALLSACAASQPETLSGPVAVVAPSKAAESMGVRGAAAYICDDGARFDVLYTDAGAKVTFATGESRTLAQYPTGSGFGYKDDLYDLRGKGDEVQFTIGRAPGVLCRDVSEAK